MCDAAVSTPLTTRSTPVLAASLYFACTCLQLYHCTASTVRACVSVCPQDTWVNRTFVVSTDKFPSALRRSVVKEQLTVELNPVEYVVGELHNKNGRLRDLIAEAQGVADGEGSQDFSLAINGVVDAAVNGGVNNFVPLLSGSFETTHPEIVEDLQRHPNKVRRRFLSCDVCRVLSCRLVFSCTVVLSCTVVASSLVGVVCDSTCG